MNYSRGKKSISWQACIKPFEVTASQNLFRKSLACLCMSSISNIYYNSDFEVAILNAFGVATIGFILYIYKKNTPILEKFKYYFSILKKITAARCRCHWKWATDKLKILTAFETLNLVYKLPFRWRCARCFLQRSKTNRGPAEGPHNFKSSEVLCR